MNEPAVWIAAATACWALAVVGAWRAGLLRRSSRALARAGAVCLRYARGALSERTVIGIVGLTLLTRGAGELYGPLAWIVPGIALLAIATAPALLPLLLLRRGPR